MITALGRALALFLIILGVSFLLLGESWQLLYFAAGYCLARFIEELGLHAQTPHQWVCPECRKLGKKFEFKSNSKSVLENVKAGHLAEFHS